MSIMSMTPDQRNIICDPDCICLQSPASPDLIRLLVYASDALPLQTGKYNGKTKTAWVTADGNQFAALTAVIHQNLEVQIEVNGTTAASLDFSPK